MTKTQEPKENHIYKDKNIKFVIASGKGGVAKSAIAAQIVTPYLHARSGKVISYYELDETNNIADTYSNSEIMKITSIKPNDEDSITAVLAKSELSVFDIGGNLASGQAIASIADTCLTDDLFFIIPIGDGEEDATQAEVAHDNIKNQIPNAKIIFALTRTISLKEEDIKTQFAFVFGHKAFDVLWYLTQEIPVENYLVMNSLVEFNVSKILKKTIWEDSSIEEFNKLKKIQNEIIASKNKAAVDTKEYQTLEKQLIHCSRELSVRKKFEAYKKQTIEPAFSVLDKLIMQ